MTDEELSSYVAMFASGNADGAVRTLVSEIRRLRAENAELRDDARPCKWHGPYTGETTGCALERARLEMVREAIEVEKAGRG